MCTKLRVASAARYMNKIQMSITILDSRTSPCLRVSCTGNSIVTRITANTQVRWERSGDVGRERSSYSKREGSRLVLKTMVSAFSANWASSGMCNLRILNTRNTVRVANYVVE